MKRMDQRQSAALRRVLGCIRPYAWLVALSLLLAALTVALTLYFPILTGDAIDRILAPGRVDFGGVAKLAVRMAIIVGITALAQCVPCATQRLRTYSACRSAILTRIPTGNS